MAQGFKASKPSASTSKASSSGRKSKSSAGPKIGQRVVPPKKAKAVKQANNLRKQQASITTRIEGEMAGRASNGPLTIMKSAADGAAAEKAAQQKKKGK
ncbi:hypothetical protein CBOM_06416 [Ceraceosorus bombacis]|uniref:Uncharacterized protein n=1 Tax=Ceraceosorus bombacis TaxID=401625 RepID=A0A0P1BJY2_9BASI|nr:hypothetical protein CBOM_06416 [Ceraceosorus bombacis]